jgi:hypothetical protein
VSTIVAVPTSKLRLAWASCWSNAAFCDSDSATLSRASSTSKYACEARIARSLLRLGERGRGLQHRSSAPA